MELNTATTAKPGGMRHVLHAWMESGSRHARLSCINEDNCICYVAVRETDIANSWQNVSKTKNINLLKIWVDCCNSCADVNIKMHINRCFLVRTGIILKVCGKLQLRNWDAAPEYWTRAQFLGKRWINNTQTCCLVRHTIYALWIAPISLI